MGKTALEDEIDAFAKECEAYEKKNLLHRNLEDIKLDTNVIEESLFNKDFKADADRILKKFSLQYDFFMKYSIKDTEDFMYNIRYSEIGEFARLQTIRGANPDYMEIVSMFIGEKAKSKPEPGYDENKKRIVTKEELNRLLDKVPEENPLKTLCFSSVMDKGSSHLTAARAIRYIYDLCFYNIHLPKRIATLIKLETVTDLGLHSFMREVKSETQQRTPGRHLEINQLINSYIYQKSPVNKYSDVAPYIHKADQLDTYLLKFPPLAFPVVLFRNSILYRLALFAIKMNEPTMDMLDGDRSLITEMTRPEFLSKLDKISGWASKAQGNEGVVKESESILPFEIHPSVQQLNNPAGQQANNPAGHQVNNTAKATVSNDTNTSLKQAIIQKYGRKKKVKERWSDEDIETMNKFVGYLRRNISYDLLTHQEQTFPKQYAKLDSAYRDAHHKYLENRESRQSELDKSAGAKESATEKKSMNQVNKAVRLNRHFSVIDRDLAEDYANTSCIEDPSVIVDIDVFDGRDEEDKELEMYELKAGGMYDCIETARARAQDPEEQRQVNYESRYSLSKTGHKDFVLLDTGANCTYSNMKEKFTRLITLDVPEPIMMGSEVYNATMIGVLRLGSFKIPGTNKIQHMDFPGAYYLDCPGVVQGTILHVNALTKNGMLKLESVAGSTDKLYDVSIPGTNIHFNTKLRQDNLPYINFSSVYVGDLVNQSKEFVESGLVLWEHFGSSPIMFELDIADNVKQINYTHKEFQMKKLMQLHRCGHVGMTNLLQAVRQNPNLLGYTTREEVEDFLKGFNVKEFHCRTCDLTKAVMPTFKTTHTVYNYPGELLVFDTKGPLPVAVNGAKWVLIVVDAYSSHIWEFSMKEKGDFAAYLLTLINRIERVCGRKVCNILSDQGSEYGNASFEKVLMANGIAHLRSNFKFHQQTGRAERGIRTVLDKTVPTMVDVSCPIELWPFAIQFATMAVNSQITRKNPKTGETSTAHEQLFGVKQKYHSVYPFGCDVVIFLHPEYKKRETQGLSSLTPKGVKGFYLGPSKTEKGFYVLNMMSMKVELMPHNGIVLADSFNNIKEYRGLIPGTTENDIIASIYFTFQERDEDMAVWMDDKLQHVFDKVEASKSTPISASHVPTVAPTLVAKRKNKEDLIVPLTAGINSDEVKELRNEMLKRKTDLPADREHLLMVQNFNEEVTKLAEQSRTEAQALSGRTGEAWKVTEDMLSKSQGATAAAPQSVIATEEKPRRTEEQPALAEEPVLPMDERMPVEEEQATALPSVNVTPAITAEVEAAFPTPAVPAVEPAAEPSPQTIEEQVSVAEPVQPIEASEISEPDKDEPLTLPNSEPPTEEPSEEPDTTKAKPGKRSHQDKIKVVDYSKPYPTSSDRQKLTREDRARARLEKSQSTAVNAEEIDESPEQRDAKTVKELHDRYQGTTGIMSVNPQFSVDAADLREKNSRRHEEIEKYDGVHFNVRRLRPRSLGPDGVSVVVKSYDEHDEKRHKDNTGRVRSFVKVPEPSVTRRLYRKGKRIHQVNSATTDEKSKTRVELMNILANSVVLPRNIGEVLRAELMELWLDAIMDEIENLKRSDTWTPISKEEVIENGYNVVQSRFVFTVKSMDNIVTKFKARLVAKGYTQEYGIDYDFIYSPVPGINNIRAVLAYATSKNMHIGQVDYTAAFLNSVIDTDVVVQFPTEINALKKAGIDISGIPKYYKLKKALYGLKQSPKRWYETLREFVIGSEMNFTQIESDQNIFVRGIGGNMVILLIYVDDTLIISESIELMNEVKGTLLKKFKGVDMGTIDKFLGIRINRDRESNQTIISSKEYVDKMIDDLNLHYVKERKEPWKTEVSAMVNETKGETVFDKKKVYPLNEREHHLYRQIVGKLRYLTTITRPDLAYAVRVLSHYLAKPWSNHLENAYHLVGYVKHTADYVIRYNGSSDLYAYADASFKLPKESNQSVAGFTIILGGAPIFWSSKRVNVINDSTRDSELVALHSCLIHLNNYRVLLEELGWKKSNKVRIYEDNMPLTSLLETDKPFGKNNYLNGRFDTVKKAYLNGDFEVERVDTKNQLADYFTKPLRAEKILELNERLQISRM